MTEFDLLIQNSKGLHARASAKLVELVESFDAQCEISKQNMTVSGDSIMGLLMLAATKGSYIKVKLWGNDHQALSLAIHDLINNYFGEES
jgi:phosphocarrier protein HPr